MTDAEVWECLGIAPTADEADLRRAYAERLKHVRPDDDPAGFRAVREAFETARRGATARAVIRPIMPSVQLAAPGTAATVRGALARQDFDGAAKIWNRAVAVGDVSFDEEASLRLEIAAATAMAPDVDLAMLDRLSHLMDWAEAARELGAAPAILEVMARRDALAWLDDLQRCAQSRWRLSAGARARNHAARLLLREAPGPMARAFPLVLRRANFAYWRLELLVHRRWVGHAIDRARVDWCARVNRRLDVRLLSIIVRAFVAWLTVVSLVSALVAAAFLVTALVKRL
jgi:hypothetical protein